MHVAQHYIRGRAFAAPSPDASTEHFPHDRVPRRSSQAKCLPLHLAVATNCSSTTTVVQLLLNAYPEGAQAVDLVSAPPAHPPRASHSPSQRSG